MKKILAITLSVILLLGLCACQSQQQPEKAAFRVGFGTYDITPTISVALSGYGNSLTRMSEGYHTLLLASCVAISDENNNTALMITLDNAAISTSLTNPAKQTISKETGIPVEQIMVSATHTHSAPDYGVSDSSAGRLVTDGIVAAAKAALADLSPATIQAGTTNTDRLNFVRHYLMNDGTYAGDNHGSTESGYKEHATEGDTQLQIIRYVRAEEGKKDIVAVNWQAHATLASSSSTPTGRETRNLISADFVGTCREYIEEETDCHFIYFQGAAGNMNPRSQITSEVRSTDCREHGKLLGDTIINYLDSLNEISTGTVSYKKYTYTAPVDHSDNHLLEVAKDIADYWAESNNYNECVKKGKEYGIYSPYHARAIVSRAGIKDDISMDLYAMSIGNISFVFFPYEMFDTNGVYIKENTPFDMTFVVGYANNHIGYIPSKEAFAYGSYEVDTRRYGEGVAEEAADAMVNMLKELKS